MNDPSSQHATEQAISDLARGLGFTLLGIAPAEPTPYRQYVRKWLEAGRHGQMQYLADRIELRLDPRRFVPGARCVIAVADRYAPVADREPVPAHGASIPSGGPTTNTAAGSTRPAATGKIARYAWGDDYHQIIKKRLHRLADLMRQRWPQDTYRPCVDTAPTFEREHARGAGLGWIGKHTLLIHPSLGSWLLLGQIVTTLAIEVARGPTVPIEDHCGQCTHCIDACPTQCIDPAGYKLDAQRCISYLTIEHRGPIDPDLHRPMGDWIAGCDVCQQVCPFNDRAAGLGPGQAARSDDVLTEAIHPKYQPRPPAPAMNLLEILGWDAEARQKTFTKSALKRIKLDQFKRNALIAAGNYLADHEDQQLRRRVEELADEDESPLLRQTAQQVLDRLNALGP